jgi:membrane-bound serine protease (ClpP class)
MSAPARRAALLSSPTSLRRLLPVVLLLAVLGIAASGPGPARADAAGTGAEPGGADRVEVLEVEGLLDRPMAGYIRSELADAAAADAAAVVLQLDVPGALDVDVAELAGEVAASEVPVVAYLGPGGAELGGGALALYQAAHVRAVSPVTILGPAAPVDLGAAARTGSEDDDLVPLERASAAAGRDAGWLTELAGDGVLVPAPPGVAELPDGARLPDGVARERARVVDADELAGGEVADVAAGSLPDVLRAVDGREVAGEAGEAAPVLSLDAGRAQTRFNNAGLVARALHGLANPSLVYLLLTAALLSLAFEWFQPGFGVAGVAGIGLAVAGGVGLWLLPFGWVGLALLVVGAVLLSLDTAAGGLGLLTAGGVAAFAGGSWLLFPDLALLRPPWWLLVLVVATVAVYFVGILTSVLRAQGQQASADAEQLIGETAVVRSMLNPEGHVFVGGNLWRAKAPDEAGRVKTGTSVRVVGLDDRLTLEVELATEPTDPPQESASRT